MPYTKSKDGTEIYFEIYGIGEGVVFSHAWTQCLSYWGEIKDWISENYTVILWDHRGHGKSGGSKTLHFKTEHLAEDLKTVIDASGFEKVTLVGHSMGGIASLKLYEAYPEIVRGLVLLNTPYKNPFFTSALPSSLSHIFKILSFAGGSFAKSIEPLPSIFTRNIWRLLLKNKIVFNFSKRVLFGNFYSYEGSDIATKEVIKYISSTPLSSRILSFHSMLSYDVSYLLPKIKVPTLLFTAKNDWMVHFKAMEKMSKKIPDSKLVFFPRNGGHMSFITQKKFFYDELKKFLQEVK